MVTRQYFHRMAAVVILAVASILGGAAASAQCACRNTVTVDASAPCCIRAIDISVECNDGNVQPFDPTVFYSFCGPNVFEGDCPCLLGMAAAVIDIGGGMLVRVPVGTFTDVRYLGDCCLRIIVSVNASGCMDINVSQAPFC